jgi:hypothetical protein
MNDKTHISETMHFPDESVAEMYARGDWEALWAWYRRQLKLLYELA